MPNSVVTLIPTNGEVIVDACIAVGAQNPKNATVHQAVEVLNPQYPSAGFSAAVYFALTVASGDTLQ